MRKMIICMLLLYMAVGLAGSLCTIPAVAVSCSSEAAVLNYYENHKDDPYIQEYFVWPEEVSILGEFQRVHIGGQKMLVLSYEMELPLADGLSSPMYLVIFSGSVNMEEILSSNLAETVEFIPLDMGYIDENMLRLNISGNDEVSWYSVRRGNLEYIYSNRSLEYIVWEKHNRTFRLSIYCANECMESGDNIVDDLLSLDAERFVEAQAQLLSIGDPNPPAQEDPCGKDYPHSYSDQWRSDAYTHYNLCSCGAKGNEGFHADENQDGACDICNYDPNAKADPDPDPVVDPTEPSQPSTEPATQPTTQPITTPATQPTASTPAEPQSPAPGLWIGISAVGILAVAAVILVIRKKKTE